MKIAERTRTGVAAAALLAAFCVLLAACGLRTNIKPAPTQPDLTLTKPTSVTRTEQGTDWGALLPGQWHADNAVGGGFNERWLFEKNGEFIHAASDYDMLNRLPFETGHWKLEGNQLQLTIEFRIQRVGGEIKTDPDGDEYIENPEIREITVTPAETKTLALGDYGEDPESERACLTVGGVTYYDYSGQTDLFDSYYYTMGTLSD